MFIEDWKAAFGPLAPLLDDAEVSELRVNAPDRIQVERRGRIEDVDVHFDSPAAIQSLLDAVLEPSGLTLNARTPIVDARLPDGSSLLAIAPPISPDSPTFYIRKTRPNHLSMDDVVKFGALTQDMRTFLEAAVKARLNIVLSGGTASGKTTTLNTLAAMIPPGEHVVVIQEKPHLKLQRAQLTLLESRLPNREGEGEVTIADLVRAALRLMPERIIVGECRGGETFDLLQAMSTGHDGSLTSIHAVTPRDTIFRLEMLCQLARPGLSSSTIARQIASAVHLIVQQSRLSDGSRKITHITEVQGMEGDTVLLQDIFCFDNQGRGAEGRVQGQHYATGAEPKCARQIAQMGISLPDQLFEPQSSRASTDG